MPTASGARFAAPRPAGPRGGGGAKAAPTGRSVSPNSRGPLSSAAAGAITSPNGGSSAAPAVARRSRSANSAMDPSDTQWSSPPAVQRNPSRVGASPQTPKHATTHQNATPTAAAAAAAAEVSSPHAGEASQSPLPLYVLSEDAAKRKFMVFHRSKEQQHQQQRAIAPQEVAMATISSPEAANPASGRTEAHHAASAAGASPLPRQASPRSARSLEMPLDPRHIALQDSGVADRSSSPPYETVHTANGGASSSLYDLTEKVMRLQTALAVARKDNLQLRLLLGKKGVHVPDGATAAYRAGSVHRASQTSSVSFAIADTTAQSPNNAPHSPSPRGPSATVVTRTYDEIDDQLEKRRCKQLEKMLVARTIETNAAVDEKMRAEEEAAQLRAASCERIDELSRLRTERDSLKRRVEELSDGLTEATRDKELALAAARNEGVLRLELTQLRSQLDRRESEVVELHGLCDYLHQQLASTRCQIDMRDLIDREGARRSAAMQEGLRGLDTLHGKFVVEQRLLRARFDEV